MDSDQPTPQPEQKPDGGFQFHLSTCVVLALLAGAMVFGSSRPQHGLFLRVDTDKYGWPLPMVYVEPNNDATKLNPTVQYNYIALYYNLTIFGVTLVAAGAFVERWMRRRDKAASSEESTPATH